MNKTTKILLLVLVLLVGIAGAAYLGRGTINRWFFRPTKSTVKDGVQDVQNEVVVARGLSVPWEVAFLPDGDYLVTERPGTLKRIGKNHQAYPIAGVQQTSEGGLLGLALHPHFVKNRYLYIYLTSLNGGGLINRVERYTLRGDALSDRKLIINNIPGEQNHDGGRIAFGPDKHLYITTGDAGEAPSAQDKTALSGKILRLTDEGAVPADNPFGNAVYSYGHRNPQGIAWDSKGQLWSTEHGPSGPDTGHDELNLIVKGGNYGWPTIKGDETRPGMIKPVAESGAAETWAPAGLAYLEGSLLFSGLRGQSLYQAKITGDNSVTLTAHLRDKYGRLRAVAVDPVGQLYVTTSNRDGRGTPTDDDDRIIRLPAAVFAQ